MAPFRSLIKAKLPFLWSAELQVAFDSAESNFVEQLAKGVTTFQVGMRTAMLTDWSTVGIVVAILQ